MARMLRIVGRALLLLVVAAGLAMTIVPRFLDRIYYDGAAGEHYDGQRFFNPRGPDTAAPPAGGSRSSFLLRYLSGSDGRPPWPEQVAVKASRPAARVPGDRMVATWIGHATVLVQTHGLSILTDPVYTERAGPFGFGPKRVAAPGIAFDDLPRIDIVLISHNHYDHLDQDTLRRLYRRDRPTIVTGLGNDSVMAQAGVRAVALDWGGQVTVRDGVKIAVVRNHHWSSRWFADRNRALWSAFVVRLPSGGNLFFAGDTGFGDGRWPAEAAAYGPVRLALLPIGAFRFARGQMSSASHVGPAEAALIYQRLGAARALPIHWGTFRLSYEAYDTPPRLLAAAARCAGASNFTPAAIGAPVEVSPVPDRPAPARSATPRANPDMTQAAMLRCLDTPEVRALR